MNIWSSKKNRPMSQISLSYRTAYPILRLRRLPVRRFRLSQEKVAELVEEAGNGGSQWLEFLHRRWAEEIRDKRDAWLGRELFGVSLWTSNNVLPKPGHPWPHGTPSPGLIFAKKDGAPISTPLPLEAEAKEWLGGLESKAIAAAWVDHGSKQDFQTSRALLDWVSLVKGSQAEIL